MPAGSKIIYIAGIALFNSIMIMISALKIDGHVSWISQPKLGSLAGVDWSKRNLIPQL
jgi:hypothetical protein